MVTKRTQPTRLPKREAEALMRKPFGHGVIAYHGLYAGVTEIHFYHDQNGVMRHLENDRPVDWPLDVAFMPEFLPGADGED